MTVAGEGLAGVTIDMKLDAVAVIFDFVNPVVTRWGFRLEGGKLGLDEARHRASRTPCHLRYSQKTAAGVGASGGQSTYLTQRVSNFEAGDAFHHTPQRPPQPRAPLQVVFLGTVLEQRANGMR